MNNKVLTLLMVAAVMWSCSRKSPQQETARYKTMTVEAKDVNVATDYSARLEGQQTVEIRPEVGGLIKKICIHESDKVKRGQVLFVINPVPYCAAYDEASANVKSAEDLDHTEVKSPVDGVAGMIAYRVGALNKI